MNQGILVSVALNARPLSADTLQGAKVFLPSLLTVPTFAVLAVNVTADLGLLAAAIILNWGILAAIAFSSYLLPEPAVVLVVALAVLLLVCYSHFSFFLSGVRITDRQCVSSVVSLHRVSMPSCKNG